MQSKSKIVIGAVAAVAALAAFYVSSSSSKLKEKPDLTGYYSHKDGTHVQFMSDGTAVFEKGGNQRIWKYTIDNDSGRLKLETAAPTTGIEPAMCNYRRTPDVFEVFGCKYAMTLQVVQP